MFKYSDELIAKATEAIRDNYDKKEEAEARLQIALWAGDVEEAKIHEESVEFYNDLIAWQEERYLK